MKYFKFFSFTVVIIVSLFSCKNDQEDFGPMKGVNYFSRNEAFGAQQISFENETGITNDTLYRLAVINISPNSFVMEDGSAFTGKVVLSIKENLVRGYMALNSNPTVLNDGSPLLAEGILFIKAVDIKGNSLKISEGKNIEINMPGGSTANVNKLYFGNDQVKDPSPANTSLFNWEEASSDSIEYVFNNNNAKYYYTIKTEKLGWILCGRKDSNATPVGITVKVRGVGVISATNTAVYIIPNNKKSVFRLWNYDSEKNEFSLDQPYLENGSQAYVIVIAYTRHFKIYYAKELITIGQATEQIIYATPSNLNSISGNLYFL